MMNLVKPIAGSLLALTAGAVISGCGGSGGSSNSASNTNLITANTDVELLAIRAVVGNGPDVIIARTDRASVEAITDNPAYPGTIYYPKEQVYLSSGTNGAYYEKNPTTMVQIDDRVGPGAPFSGVSLIDDTIPANSGIIILQEGQGNPDALVIGEHGEQNGLNNPAAYAFISVTNGKIKTTNKFQAGLEEIINWGSEEMDSWSIPVVKIPANAATSGVTIPTTTYNGTTFTQTTETYPPSQIDPFLLTNAGSLTAQANGTMPTLTTRSAVVQSHHSLHLIFSKDGKSAFVSPTPASAYAGKLSASTPK